MKKVLALVLAVMMMATVAFAAPFVINAGEKDYGKKVTIDSGDVKDALIDVPTDKKTIKDVNSDNYSITAIKYNEGRDLIKGVVFNDDDDTVEVKLVDNYTNTKSKTFDVQFTLKGKGKSKPTSVDFQVKGTVGNELNETALNIKETDTVEMENADENIVYKVKGGKGDDGKDYKYATLDLTAADTDVEVEVRIYDGDKLYLFSKVDADKDVLKKYADTDAELTFLSFPGKPTFNATATVRFYKDEGTYIYANNGDGNLSRITAANAGAAGQTAGNVKWDDEEGCYILKARTLGSYVFSDKPLKVSAAADSATTTNPDTGANDVVGVATALAAVALVSAAAVSLKK